MSSWNPHTINYDWSGRVNDAIARALQTQKTKPKSPTAAQRGTRHDERTSKNHYKYTTPRFPVAETVSFEDNVYTLQVPVLVQSANAGGAKWSKEGMVAEQKARTFGYLNRMLRSMAEDAALRKRIVGLTMVRISPKEGLDEHDNLGHAFKAVTDAVCTWILFGDKSHECKNVGNSDGKVLKKRSGKGSGWVKWNEPQQVTDAEHSKAMGIRILLHLSSSQK